MWISFLTEGETSGGAPSTLVDMTGPVRLLREGPIGQQAIRELLEASGIPVPDPSL